MGFFPNIRPLLLKKITKLHFLKCCFSISRLKQCNHDYCQRQLR